jgi:cobalt-precorrin 5A hydrolase
MDMDQVMLVAGIGCRKGASGDQIAAAIASALATTDRRREALDVIAAPAAKIGEPGIAAAACALGVPLVLVPQNDLEAAGARAQTHSERVVALMGVPSVAETAALAAAGPSARLLAARIAVGPVTCALAESENTP